MNSVNQDDMDIERNVENVSSENVNCESDHIKQDESEENEEFDNVSDLEESKRIQELNVEGNTANNQIIIQNLYNNYNSEKPQQTKEFNSNKDEKSYNLYDVDDCIGFVEAHKADEYVATALVLCTFDTVMLTKLSELRDLLMQYLPRISRSDSEEEEENAVQCDPYVSLNTIMAVIGGQKVLLEDGQYGVRVGDNSNIVFMNLLEQFPTLKATIIEWLIQITYIYREQNVLNVNQLAVAFERLASYDMLNAEHDIFSRLYIDSDNVWLMGVILYRLYKNPSQKGRTEELFVRWLKVKTGWMWKITSLAYSIMALDGDNHYEKEVSHAIQKQLFRIKGGDMRYMSTLLIQSSHYRTAVCRSFDIAFNHENSTEYKLKVSQNYVNLLRYCYYLVNKSYVELPLAACDTQQQQKNLRCVIENVMETYHLRKQLYAILESYLKELQTYHISNTVFNHITAFFYNMSLLDMGYRIEVMDFLDRCNNEIANQIRIRLQGIYGQKGGKN